jgi:hypothetical protein
MYGELARLATPPYEKTRTDYPCRHIILVSCIQEILQLYRGMSALRCLCCEHVNRVGEKSCEQCFSTLNLKLCENCEAINESSAQRCYKCDAKFPTEPAVDQLKSVQTALAAADRRLTTAPADPPFRAGQSDASSKQSSTPHSLIAAVTKQPRLSRPSARPWPLSRHRAVVSASNRSAARRVRAFRTVLSALLLAAIVGLAYYVYREPTLILYAIDIVRRSLVEADRRSIAVSGVIVTAGADRADASTGGATQPAPPAEDAQQPVERPPDQPRVNVRQAQPGAQRKPCEELKSEIEAKLKSKGVIRYSLDVVTPTDVKDGKVVGSCDGGTKNSVYKRADVKQNAQRADVEQNAQRAEQQSGYFDPSN